MNYEKFCIYVLNHLLSRTWSQSAGAPQTSCCPKVGCEGWNSMNLRNRQHTASAWRREFLNLSWWQFKDSSSNTCCSPTRRDGECQRKIIIFFIVYAFLNRQCSEERRMTVTTSIIDPNRTTRRGHTCEFTESSNSLDILCRYLIYIIIIITRYFEHQSTWD